MIRVIRQPGPGLYDVVDERIIARDMTKADAETIARLLNEQAESKTPTRTPAEMQVAVNRKLDAVPIPDWTSLGWLPSLRDTRQDAVNSKLDKITIEAEQLVPGCGCSVCEAIRQHRKKDLNSHD